MPIRGNRGSGKSGSSGAYDSPFGAIIGGLMQFLGLGNLWAKLSGDSLSDAELEANAFNAEQASITRDFNASEAEKQRQWEEYMTQNRYQFQMADMQAAGVNPALMYGGGQSPASVPSGSAASAGAAASATSGEPSGGVLDTILRAIMTKSQVDNMKADTSLKYADRDLALANAQYIGVQSAWYPALNEATLREVDSRIRGNNAAANLDDMKAAHERVMTTIDEIEASWRDRLLETRQILESNQSEEAKANAASAFARAAVDQIEAKYMRENNARMGSSELVTIANYILNALGTNTQEVVNPVLDVLAPYDGDAYQHEVDVFWSDPEHYNPARLDSIRVNRTGKRAHFNGRN